MIMIIGPGALEAREYRPPAPPPGPPASRRFPAGLIRHLLEEPTPLDLHLKVRYR